MTISVKTAIGTRFTHTAVSGLASVCVGHTTARLADVKLFIALLVRTVVTRRAFDLVVTIRLLAFVAVVTLMTHILVRTRPVFLRAEWRPMTVRCDAAIITAPGTKRTTSPRFALVVVATLSTSILLIIALAMKTVLAARTLAMQTSSYSVTLILGCSRWCHCPAI
jgi:hypothetical protein